MRHKALVIGLFLLAISVKAQAPSPTTFTQNGFKWVCTCTPVAAPHSVTLAWKVATTGGPATGYKIYRSTASPASKFLATVGAVTTFTDTAVTPGVTYFYRATAFNQSGEAWYSNEVSKTIPNSSWTCSCAVTQ